MAVGALELRYVAQVNRVLEAPVALVTGGAVELALAAQRHCVPERAVRRRRGDSPFGLIQHRVADSAVLADHAPRVAGELAVVTAEAPLEVEVADVVRMRLPVGLHLREGIGLE